MGTNCLGPNCPTGPSPQAPVPRKRVSPGGVSLYRRNLSRCNSAGMTTASARMPMAIAVPARAADASAREVVWSGPLAMPPSSVLDQLGQFLPRVEHASLHRCGRNTEYLRALINRLLVVVNEFDDFPMFQR